MISLGHSTELQHVDTVPSAITTAFCVCSGIALGFALEGNFFNEVPGDFFGSTMTANVVARYPLDTVSPGVHLAPYALGGIGGLFNQNNFLSTRFGLRYAF